MTLELGIDLETEGSLTTLLLSGEIDYGNVAKLRTALIDLSSSGANHIDIDLADVEFLDSTALSVLVQAKRRLSDSGQQVGIVNPRQRVKRVLELAGLLEYLQA